MFCYYQVVVIFSETNFSAIEYGSLFLELIPMVSEKGRIYFNAEFVGEHIKCPSPISYGILMAIIN